MNSSRLPYFIFMVCAISLAAFGAVAGDESIPGWFQARYSSFFQSFQNDTNPPVIFGATIVPSSLKIGDPRAEIKANVYDPAGIRMVYAEVGGRMNLMMLDLRSKNWYMGYCGSNLPPGTYKVGIVAIDKAGNAARNEDISLTIRDPRDLNGNHVEDSLEELGNANHRVIVLHDGSLPGLAFQGISSSSFKTLPGSSLIVPGSKLEELSKLKGVKGIYKDQKLKVLASTESSPLPRKGIDNPRKEYSMAAEGITVALIDTGVDPAHEAFSEGNILVFKDFVNNQSSPYDDNGHGTHCASLIGGAGEQGGVAPGANLAVIKVMDRDGACYLSDAIKALDWCLENKDKFGIKVISFSVGGENPSEETSLLDEACNEMVEKGIVMCVAAGNSGPTSKSIVTPGGAEKVITVGAIDSRGAVFERSSRGPASNGEIKPDIVTLGVDVVSALSGTKDQYSPISGTSMAVPQVSGAAALLIGANSSLGPSDVKRILLKTADDLGEFGPDNIYGYGAMNVTMALGSIIDQPQWLAGAAIDWAHLSRTNATVGEPVNIEAKLTGEAKEIVSKIIGPDKTMEISLEDFDSNGIYSGPWETSFWSPGDYQVVIDLKGRYGEAASFSIPFRLDPKP